MPTDDAEYRNEGRPNVVTVSRNGKLLPEVVEVFKVMAKHNLGLSTGHCSPEEVLMLIRAARRPASTGSTCSTRTTRGW